MKKLYMMMLLASILNLTGCNTEIDNWDYPTSQINGRFLYNGEPVRIKGTVTESAVDNMIQLNQVGPSEYTPGFLKMNARDDGSYTILTFDGNYEMCITPGRGPWVPLRDTIRFTLSGTKNNVDFNVTPYFWIENYQTTYADSVFTATFELQQVAPAARLRRIVAYFGSTTILDQASRTVERAFATPGLGQRTIRVDLKNFSATEKRNLARTGLLFSRIGVQAEGAADLLYSSTTSHTR
ncbi:DUF3823 domain-containing protein [Sphingobacterium oryzagri]|uniref:DUF3823 domain-containing protein n=1 Tax=Sphingobacterium oryzagri TaxID=3025669 RepID=A0ABY7WF95_9SPHI|nr:DUF3823 domain-containing protein [Sphingobacterium sp. KACC 22765]WDF67048.1 DUF3823 domain-containing protein [Sphingobacterium sp. KACC 22765]